ncbi:hypothetical protein [Alteromonas sp. 14N.309.X.WAT.G.H12]|uniref:hypothetical protein n=1 Tax=Alteromonas sp. 14N.309.X.WAT.G.H12 TaxID=3120824 RepID=UPI002FD1A4E5
MRRVIWQITLIPLLLSGLIAIVATWLDYAANPSQIFFENGEIHWLIVLATFNSWFFPGLVLVFLVCLIVLILVSVYQK